MIVEPSDLYHDVDDVGILADMVKKIEKERDDLEEYWEKLKRYKRLMKVLDSQNPLFHLSDDDLLSAYENGRFEPPKHKWDGRVPCIAVWFDDILGSQLMSGKGARQLAKLCMYHRHLGQFSHIGGAVGCSMIFCAKLQVCPRRTEQNAAQQPDLAASLLNEIEQGVGGGRGGSVGRGG